MALDRDAAAALGRLFDRSDRLWRRLRARSENPRLGSEGGSTTPSRGLGERTGKAAVGARDPRDGYGPGRLRQKSVTATFPDDFEKAGNASARDPWRCHLCHRRAWTHAIGEQLYGTRQFRWTEFRFSPIFFGGPEARRSRAIRHGFREQASGPLLFASDRRWRGP